MITIDRFTWLHMLRVGEEFSLMGTAHERSRASGQSQSDRDVARMFGHTADHDDCPEVLHYLCHDISLSMATVRTLAEVACGERDVPPPVWVRLQQVASEAQQISTLCGNVLEPPQAAVVRLDLLAAKAVESARLAHSAHIELRATPAELLGYSSSIWRLLTNLIDNACRIAGMGGRVHVSVDEDEDEGSVYLCVADSGSAETDGGPEEEPRARTRPPLGLRIVDEIVKQHGASIQVNQNDLGGTGTTVLFPSSETVVDVGGEQVAEEWDHQ
jgi:signal transduction histidine kinase